MKVWKEMVASTLLVVWISVGWGCPFKKPSSTAEVAPRGPYVVVLGVAQDAGYPQAGCRKDCCKRAWKDPSNRRRVVALGLVDPKGGKRWMVEATPDFKEQLRHLQRLSPRDDIPGLDGIFLTHGHIGHYTGLIHLGREVIGAKGVPVYAMPRMQTLLRQHGPWSQLVKLKNISIQSMVADKEHKLSARISVTPIQVPHRDEFTETVGFVIRGPRRKVLFIPDIDKWSRWKVQIESLLAKVDIAYLDGTFFDGKELPGRNMAQIPHPFIQESLARFQSLPPSERAKIRFIHFNHTNPVLQPNHPAQRLVRKKGFGLTRQGEFVPL